MAVKYYEQKLQQELNALEIQNRRDSEKYRNDMTKLKQTLKSLENDVSSLDSEIDTSAFASDFD